MKLLGTAGAAALSLMLAFATLGYAQDQKPEDQKPESKPAEQAKPAPANKKSKAENPERNDRAQQEQQKAEQKQDSDRAKQAEQQQKQAADQEKQAADQQKHEHKSAKDQQKAQQDQQKQAEQSRKQQEKLQKQQADQEKQARQNGRPAQNAPAPQAEAANRGGREHIPDDKFRAHFGREHHFHVNRPVVVEGEPRFQYSGFWFVMLDPWPAAWSYDDDVYIDYIDGMYYLCDPVHPGIQIAINVVG